jgi:hypothetical protein
VFPSFGQLNTLHFRRLSCSEKGWQERVIRFSFKMKRKEKKKFFSAL